MKKTFTIVCEMEARWIPYFLGMLERMQRNGNIGHSEEVGIYSDGDADFRPKFKYPAGYSIQLLPTEERLEGVLFDAG